jgi:cytochrome b6-f complex iron-sulfur subunit
MTAATALFGVTSLSQEAVAVIVVSVMAALFVLILGNTLIQQRRHGGVTPAAQRGAGPVPDGEASPKRVQRTVDRRSFFRGGLLAALGAFTAEFGGASLAFLWPNLKGGFGSVVTAGNLSDIKNFIDQNRQPFYSGSGRFYIVPYNGNGASTVYAGITQEGLMALYQKCVHLGCRVPFCQTSQWFECPCHGSKYNEAGEYQLGPAPTGLNRFKLTVEGPIVKVDTSTIVPGPPRGTNTTHQSPEGPFCV